jgi:hypothetical protein
VLRQFLWSNSATAGVGATIRIGGVSIQSRARRRRNLSLFQACAVALFSGFAVLATACRTEGHMDRSAAVLGASVHDYANYLYLSELFGKPTAIPLFEDFCGKTLDEGQVRKLQDNIQQVIQQDFWSFKCAPVVPHSIKKNSDGTFELTIAFIKLMDSRVWLEKFKTAVLANQMAVEPLIPEDRQLQLSRYYVPSTTKPPNLFSKFGNTQYIGVLLADMRKVAKNISEGRDEKLFAELKFSNR